jgi:hypothetical protein
VKAWPTGRLVALLVFWFVVLAAAMPNHLDREESFVLYVSSSYAAFFGLRLTIAHFREEKGRAWLLHIALLVTSPLWALGLARVVVAFVPDPFHMIRR